MTTTTLTPAQRLTVVKHLANGRSLDTVATICKIPRETVLDIGSHHGYPSTAKLTWAVEILAKKIDEQASTLPERAPDRAPQPQVARPPVAATQQPEALTRPDEIRILLNTAKAHPTKRIQNAANKVFDDLDKLRALIAEDQEKHAERRKAEQAKAAARAEVERLEAQLREAKAKLRGKVAAPKSSVTTPPTDQPAEQYPCSNDGCDRVFDSPQGRSMHERMKCQHRNTNEEKTA